MRYAGKINLYIIALMVILLNMDKGNSQSKWKGTIVKEGDVIHIKNPREPIFNTPVLELTEELSIGGSRAQGNFVFGQVSNIVIDHDGSIYLLDTQNSHIKVFNISGEYVRTIGQRGQGPGELDSPWTLSINRTTGELAVLQLSRRISFFKTGGEFIRHLHLKDMSAFRAEIDSVGNIFITESLRSKEGTSYVTKKISSYGAITLASPASAPGQPYGKINPFIATSYFKIDGEDNLIYGYPITYDIQFFSASEQKLFKKITKEYDPIIINEEDREEEISNTPQAARSRLDFPKYYPAYRRFFLSDMGYLFVQTWKKTKDGKIMHDIFDAEGKFINRISMKQQGVEILNGKYYALETDSDGYQIVKRYGVAWLIK